VFCNFSFIFLNKKGVKMKKYLSLVLIYCLVLITTSTVFGQTKTFNEQPKPKNELKNIFFDAQSKRSDFLLGNKILPENATKIKPQDLSNQAVKSKGVNKKWAIIIGVGIAAAIIIVFATKKDSTDDGPGCDPITPVGCR
jgi:hypothetical protein